VKAVALNIGANSSSPGGRGPIHSDGSFRYVPIAEADESVDSPTYEDLGLNDIRPDEVRDTVTHFDPAFPEISESTEYTYGDRHPPKTTEIERLEEGDLLFFYATLDYVDDRAPEHEWINEDWGAYIIGHFTLEYDPITKEEYHTLPQEVKERLGYNAHVRREEFDAEYLVLGNRDDSQLYDTPIPLSGTSGTEANQFVTTYSKDSGDGPWYRRPLRYDREGTRSLLQVQRSTQSELGQEPSVVNRTKIDPDSLGTRGQLQFFFHAPESPLPVRDIVGKSKTEPHLEKRAENYCNECYQRNISGFLNDSSRRYLFLFTKCRNEDLVDSYGTRYVVGYIEKENRLDMGDHVAAQGPTRVVDFEDAVPLSKVVDSYQYVRSKVLDESTTSELVKRLAAGDNMLEECLSEVERLKEQSWNSNSPSRSDGC
jgi:hypothetical protein